MNALATVDLVRTTQPNSLWHIVALPDRERTLCSWAVGEDVLREHGLDTHVVAYKGKPVCSRCRRALR